MNRTPRPEHEERHARFVAVVASAIVKADREHAAHLARLRPVPKIARRQWQGRRA